MAIDQDFIDQYKQLLILQYSDKEKAVAEINVLIRTWSKVFDLFNSFFDEFDIDQAFGDRLDIIGRIVGVNRIVEDGILKKYFGFSGITNALTFGKGTFFDLFKDAIYTDTELNDTQFRFFIKAKIAKNTTSAYMVNDDRISLQKTIRFLFSDRAFIIDRQDMTLDLYVDVDFPAEDFLLLTVLNLLPKPQGVRYSQFFSYSASGTFGFSSNPNAVGFGAGIFAKIII